MSVSTYYSPHCTAVFSTTYACLPGVQAYLDPLFCCENQGKCAGTPTRPAEHRGTVGIRPNLLFSLTNFQPGHTVILSDRTSKNGPSLVLPSSLSRDYSAPKTKIIFQFLWGILEGQPNRARPSQPILKNCQNGTFLPVDEIWKFFGPNHLIWSAMKMPFCDFIQNVPQAPSMCISNWI